MSRIRVTDRMTVGLSVGAGTTLVIAELGRIDNDGMAVHAPAVDHVRTIVRGSASSTGHVPVVDIAASASVLRVEETGVVRGLGRPEAGEIGSSVVEMTGARAKVLIEGLVSGAQGVCLTGNSGSLTIGETGVVRAQQAGGTGVEFDADGSAGYMLNQGLIFAQGVGLYLNADGAKVTAAIYNTGTISGRVGLDIHGHWGDVRSDLGWEFSARGEYHHLVNDSRIIGRSGVAIRGEADGFRLLNSGEIEGNVRFGAGTQAIDNTGKIEGTVRLGAGNDYYHNFLGGEVSGPVFGGSGRDTLISNQASVDFRGGSGADVLSSGAGDDTLSGGSGNDTLSAGTGSNVLNGGVGADLFVFWKNGDTRNLITDYSAVEGDRINLSDFHLINRAEALALASETAEGVLLDLTALDGGTVLLAGVTDASDLLFIL